MITSFHQIQLAKSAILPEVIASRGYRSVTSVEEIATLGFSKQQMLSGLPGLLIPSIDATGTTHYQLRPDKLGRDRPKYETPVGKGTYGLDIPPSIREQVLHSNTELWITEGCKKADAAVSAGLCCISLPGVWMFTRKNAAGVKEALPDWDKILLNGRIVVLCYDSDAMTKSSVHEALRHLANLLRKYRAVVRFCYLPDDGYTKVGLDDYLAAGHTVEQLAMLVRERLEPIATEPVQALIAALNRKCKGKATFTPKVCHITGEEQNEGILSVLRAISKERDAVNEEMHFWMGDAYNRLNLPHGSKLSILDNVIGKAWRVQIGQWGVVCRAFSGEREYFRYAAPFWFLREIARLPESLQDDLLADYLQENLNREQVRERIPQEYRSKKNGNDNEGGTPSEPGSLPPAVTEVQALHALFNRMSAEDNVALEKYRSEYGETPVNIRVNELLPILLHQLIQQIPIGFDSEYQAERDSLYSSLCIEEGSSDTAPITNIGDQSDMSDPAVIETETDEIQTDLVMVNLSETAVSVIENASIDTEAGEGEDPFKFYAGVKFDEVFEKEMGENSTPSFRFAPSAGQAESLPVDEQSTPFDAAPEVGTPDGRATLLHEVRRAWLKLEPTPPLLTRLLQREVTSCRHAIETATVPELQILLDYGRSKILPPHMRC